MGQGLGGETARQQHDKNMTTETTFDGGPAFPRMSLRAYLAGLAMQGEIACERPEFVTGPDKLRGLTREQVIAESSVQMADALIAELGKQ